MAVAAGLVLGVAPGGAAAAQLSTPAPVEQRSDSMVTAEPLPTAQIDSGVVWVTKIIGDVAYAGGQFSAARPAGAAKGQNTVPRSNLLAFSVTTGELKSFAPVINGQVKSLAASPDGKRLYVGGSFTVVDGKSRYNIAAFDTATGALLDTFKPAVGGSYVNAITVSGTTVYIGGLFSAATGIARTNLAAFESVSGKLLGWAPTTNRQVDTMVMTPKGDKVVVGGRFTLVNGTVSQLGLTALNPSTGAVFTTWIAPQVVKNGSNSGVTAGTAGIWSLVTDADSLYATGWVMKGIAAGNLEGSVRINPDTGAITWMEDCHGDQYGSYADGQTLYVTGHPHDCVSVGGFPEKGATNVRHSLAFTKEVRGTLAARVANASYANWGGQPAPAMVNWIPSWTTGTASGQGQAAWAMDGNGQYLVVGGEFPVVSGLQQYGLVRFARPNVAGAGGDGPRLYDSKWATPSGTSTRSGMVMLSIPANFDRDDLTLTYSLVREGVTAPLGRVKANSTFWDLSTVKVIGFDSTMVGGQAYKFKVTATDSDGNISSSNWISVTNSTKATNFSDYAKAAIGDGAALYWPVGGADGATDLVGSNNATVGTSVSQTTEAGALGVSGNPAARFNGATTSTIGTTTAATNPQSFTVEGWFRTTTTTGGKLIGFGSAKTGQSTSNDRNVYLRNDGKVTFGVYPGKVVAVTSTAAYNDGKWHHVAASLGQNGTRLYLDGAEVAANANTAAEALNGYWRLGGDTISTGWPDRPTAQFFTGDLDEFALYSAPLTLEQVKNHYAAGSGFGVLTPVLKATVSANSVKFSAESSSPAGAITSYQWDFGDGSSGSGAVATHAYKASGTYRPKLTVVDRFGRSAAVFKNVTVTDQPAAPTASFTAASSGLKLSVDAAGSTTTTATSLKYAWVWGDGTAAGSGVTANHTYAKAGSYDVTLTVTDGLGGTGSATNRVTVNDPASATVASANFDRALSSGWGTAEVGGDWSTSGKDVAFSVSGGAARMALLAKVQGVAELKSASGSALEGNLEVALDQLPVAKSVHFDMDLLRAPTGDTYRSKLLIDPTGSTILVVAKVVGGVETVIASKTVSGFTWGPNGKVNLRFVAISDGTTATLRAKAWAAGSAEPGWRIETVDSEKSLQRSGYVALVGYAGQITNKVQLSIDNFGVKKAG